MWYQNETRAALDAVLISWECILVETRLQHLELLLASVSHPRTLEAAASVVKYTKHLQSSVLYCWYCGRRGIQHVKHSAPTVHSQRLSDLGVLQKRVRLLLLDLSISEARAWGPKPPKGRHSPSNWNGNRSFLYGCFGHHAAVG